jgi:hypothetical protein
MTYQELSAQVDMCNKLGNQNDRNQCIAIANQNYQAASESKQRVTRYLIGAGIAIAIFALVLK